MTTEKTIEPALSLNRFNCPTCGCLADQAWFNAYLSRINNPAGVPLRIQGADLQRLAENPQFPPEVREQKIDYWNKVNAGALFIDRWAPIQSDLLVAGMELSACHECMAVGVWMGGKLIRPAGA